LIDVISRWLHVATAIVLLGGAVFQWLVLRPSARQLSESEHDRLRELVLRRWRIIVMAGIVLLIATGLYNYLGAARPVWEKWKGYHPLMSVKILLAVPVFFLASALAGRSAAFAGIRKQVGIWLPILLLLGAGIVAISSYLKVMGPKVFRQTSVSQTIPILPHPSAGRLSSTVTGFLPATRGGFHAQRHKLPSFLTAPMN
jgi:uncharacterized membrane protein